MLIFRALVLLLLVAALLCMGMYLGTGQVVWRRRSVAIIRWSVIAGLAFIGVLLLERI
ncbi:conserved hypothetical protein [Leptothrix cholodnii SP-6]|uniref:Transmembrane protein n=1 Tax=Leptothrix cholodnii (strain ATCC 51168 / LMG 8142 / SP-6) TaxID=395495 RepID=B1XYS0_LEPCP|nr:hypothetical protein [Leptothrix cholodnii]ACB32804.1 conserved hypothetical protein [Leptothrix cholodnii SP-6]